MQLARVIGCVVATVKNDSLEGRKLLVVQSLNADLEPQGAPLVALDSVDAGEGDTVLIVQEGWGASTAATGEQGAAIDSAIVGVVDRIDLLAEEVKRKR